MLLNKLVMLLSCLKLTITQSSTNDYVQCREDLKSKNSFVSERFKEKQLEKVCKKFDGWTAAKSKPVDVKIRTPAQEDYVQHIHQCVGKKCLHKTHDQSRMFDPAHNHSSRVTRKEYRTLTDGEREKFHKAVNKLKTDMIDGESKYNLLVRDHFASVAPEAHWGCSFLPYHRELLKQMEVALRLEDHETFIPYWDSTLDEGLADPCDSVIFSPSLIGNAKGVVTTGPFAHWNATEPAPGQNDTYLYRDCGKSDDGDLYQLGDLKYFMTFRKFKQHCYCHNPAFEGVHGLVHEFVGGHMASIPLSANDPLFFLHHAFVDYLWEEWRSRRQNEYQRQIDYPRNRQACGREYDAFAPMKPFKGLKIINGLQNNYTDHLYVYHPRPTCPDTCTGPYLFCTNSTNTHNARCLSKINVGGNCQGYENSESCFEGKCISNVCVKNK